MSLVNSFINQIGRELGRDAYRSVLSPSASNKRKMQSAEAEMPIFDQVINFELLANDEKTFRCLANLVEKAEHTDPEDFEWNELFFELDNKIAFCKANLSDEYRGQLEKLDEINAQNFKFIKSKHIIYIDSVILYFENKSAELSKKNMSVAAILTVFGLRPSYMGEKFIYTLINILYIILLGVIGFNAWMTYQYPALFNGNLPIESPADIALVKSMGKVMLAIPLGFYLLFFLLGLRKILKYKKEIQNNFNSKIKFETYKSELLK
jgi:hypothetical protein